MARGSRTLGLVRERIPEIRRVSSKERWEFVVQQHATDSHGTHYDLRLGDPYSRHGHSWVLRYWPVTERRLAVRQPDHDISYFDFTGRLHGKGAGQVTQVLRTQVDVLEARSDLVRFVLRRGQQSEEYVLRHTDGDRWLIQPGASMGRGALSVIKLARMSEEERKRRDREWHRQHRWKVTPQAHQLRVHQRLDKAPGVLAMHQVGAGKTITAITAADHLGVPGTAVVPAALRENFRKELHKVGPRQRFNVQSYEGFTKQPDARGKLLVVDEGQRLRNPDSARSKAVREAARAAYKRLVLSGTPIQNHPEELAPVMNTVAGSNILPMGQAFRERYVAEEKVDPGFVARLRGVQPGIQYKIQHQGELARRIRGMVDYHGAKDDAHFPSISHDHHEVEMDKRQAAVYHRVLQNMPHSIFHKMERNLPPSKQESKQLNAFLTAARIVSNTPAPYQKGMTHEEGFARSPKLQAILGDIQKAIEKNPRHKSIVYSNYLEGGVEPMASALRAAGIPHHVFKGGLSDKERKKIVEDYNSGKVKVLLISGAGAEGLDTKGTRMVHLMEPHWNEGRTEQVIGRARRYGSHGHLPLKERHVHVRTYHSTVPKTFWQQQVLGRLGKDKRSTSTDQYMAMLARRKQELIDQFHEVMKQEGTRPV